MACNLPRQLLEAVPSAEAAGAPFLRLLPAQVLKAMSSSYVGGLADPKPWLEGQVMLAPQSIVRAYLLDETPPSPGSPSGSGSRPHFHRHHYHHHSGGAGGLLKSAKQHAAAMKHEKEGAVLAPCQKRLGSDPVHIEAPATCGEYLARLEAIRGDAKKRGLEVVYHYTTPSVGASVLSGGFRMSTQGQGDGGVYFSTLGPCSYGLGTPNYEKNLITDCFGAARLDEYRGKHKLDLCFIYGAEPKTLHQAPGGRDNAKVVSKGFFEEFSLLHPDGAYYLRPDHILGAFLLDPEAPPALISSSSIVENAVVVHRALRLEGERDRATKESLAETGRSFADNERRVSAILREVRDAAALTGVDSGSGATAVVGGDGGDVATPAASRAITVSGWNSSFDDSDAKNSARCGMEMVSPRMSISSRSLSIDPKSPMALMNSSAVRESTRDVFSDIFG